MSPKVEANLAKMIENIKEAYAVNPAPVGALIERARKEAHRHMKAGTAPEGTERITFAPTRGPNLSFTGTQVYEERYGEMTVELCQTLAGKLVLFSEWPNGGDLHSIALAFEPDDMIGIMDALHWNTMARTMARKLGWVLTVEVE